MIPQTGILKSGQDMSIELTYQRIYEQFVVDMAYKEYREIQGWDKKSVWLEKRLSGQDIKR